MNLYQKYGLTISLDRYLDKRPGQSEFSPQLIASSVPPARFRVAVCSYLIGDRIATIEHAQLIGKEVLDYFYDSWRSKVKQMPEQLSRTGGMGA